MTGRNHTGRRRRDVENRQVQAFASRTYIAALQRADQRRRGLGIDGKFPTVAAALGLDELEVLLATLPPAKRGRLERGKRLDPMLQPLVAELELLLRVGRAQETQGLGPLVDELEPEASA